MDADAGDAPASARGRQFKETPQQTVETQGSTIIIQPAIPRSFTSLVRPMVSLRISHRGVARMVPLSGNLVWRPTLSFE